MNGYWKAIFAIKTAIISALVSVSVWAQEPMSQKTFKQTSAKLYGGCSKDIVKYCSTITVTPKRVLLCLEAHDDKLRGGCRNSVFNSSNMVRDDIRKYTIVAETCWADIEKLCTDTSLGEGRIAQCLFDNRKKVSAECATQLVN